MNKYGFLLTQNPMGGSNLAEMAFNTGRLYIRGNCPISDLDENFKVTHITLDMTTSPAMKYLLVGLCKFLALK
jgi:hypothetical protein